MLLQKLHKNIPFAIADQLNTFWCTTLENVHVFFNWSTIWLSTTKITESLARTRACEAYFWPFGSFLSNVAGVRFCRDILVKSERNVENNFREEYRKHCADLMKIEGYRYLWMGTWAPEALVGSSSSSSSSSSGTLFLTVQKQKTHPYPLQYKTVSGRQISYSLSSLWPIADRTVWGSIC